MIVIVVEHATLKKRLPVNLLAPKKGAVFSFIYFFKLFCIYYVPHGVSHATFYPANSFYLLPSP